MKHKQALFHSAKDEKGKSNQRRARGKTKIFMEMFSFSKGKEILTHDKTQFESVHMSEAHTRCLRVLTSTFFRVIFAIIFHDRK